MPKQVRHGCVDKYKHMELTMLYQPISDAEFHKKSFRDGMKLALISVTSGVLMAVAVASLLVIAEIW